MIELHTDFRRNLIPRKNVPIYITSWTVCKHGLFWTFICICAKYGIHVYTLGTSILVYKNSQTRNIC